MFLNPILRGFENAKRYKIRNKKLLKLPRGGGAKTAQGGGENFLRAARANFWGFAHFIALRAIFVPEF